MPDDLKLRPFAGDELRSLAGRAYERIRDAIVAGTLAPGQRISERGLAATLDISAQPVRAALRQLETEGMVESRPRSGTYVADLSPARLVEIGLIRAALEGLAAALAATRATEADRAALRRCLADIEATTRQGDRAALAAANAALHEALHQAAASPDIQRLRAGLRAYDHLTRARILGTAEEPARALAEHAAIVAAVLARDPAAAEAAIRAHTLRSLAIAFPDSAATPSHWTRTP
ncbi:GntR family transcriptional regulator [Roseomonas sp. AR75]|uniref:GntR family transcriptional regulator n=1 Tax=Roseomonas sp. AR75 TaxID=2562311 RepID=UPI001F0FE2A6|nr:GntR family transcriptional regulator [Roseomonas sp. AR75]